MPVAVWNECLRPLMFSNSSFHDYYKCYRYNMANIVCIPSKNLESGQKMSSWLKTWRSFIPFPSRPPPWSGDVRPRAAVAVVASRASRWRHQELPANFAALLKWKPKKLRVFFDATCQCIWFRASMGLSQMSFMTSFPKKGSESNIWYSLSKMYAKDIAPQ